MKFHLSTPGVKMFCRKCGKEISDNSKFCYSCGLKVEIKEKQNTATDIPSSVIDKKTSTETKNIEQTISGKQDEFKLKNLKFTLNKYGYGWIILIILCVFVYGTFEYSKNFPVFDTFISILIRCSIITVLLVFYIWFRSFLIKRNFGKGNIKLSSCLSFIVSSILMFLIVGSISFIGKYEKGKSPTITSKIQDSEEWDWIYRSGSTDYYYYKTIVTKSSQRISVWVSPDSNKREETISTMLFEINCNNGKLKRIQTNQYDSSNYKLKSVSPQVMEWRNIIPESAAGKMYYKLCKNPKILPK